MNIQLQFMYVVVNDHSISDKWAIFKCYKKERRWRWWQRKNCRVYL